MLSRLNDAHETTHIHLLHILKLAELCASKFRLWNFGFLIENLVKKSSFWSDYCASFSLIPTTHPTHTPPTQNFFFTEIITWCDAPHQNKELNHVVIFLRIQIYIFQKKGLFPLYFSPHKLFILWILLLFFNRKNQKSRCLNNGHFCTVKCENKAFKGLVVESITLRSLF